ncbi:MAG: FKBP-type peptidyl-prolyl cis-trans isomerase [Bacteroidales bacterium]
MKKLRFLVFTIFVLVSATSCIKSQYEKDIEIIENYIKDYKLDQYNIIEDESGIYYVELKKGSGTGTIETDSIVYSYSLRLANNVEVSFAREDNPEGSNISDLVYGIRLGILKMKEGGEAVFLIPSHLGYGPYSFYNPNTGTIPPNSVLIFYINLHKVIRE